MNILPLYAKLRACCRTLMEKYRDLPMDLADGTLVAVAEHSKIVFTLDQRDFSIYRPNQTNHFEIFPALSLNRGLRTVKVLSPDGRGRLGEEVKGSQSGVQRKEKWYPFQIPWCYVWIRQSHSATGSFLLLHLIPVEHRFF